MGGVKIPIFGWLLFTIILIGGFTMAIKNNKILLQNDKADRETFKEEKKKFDSQFDSFFEKTSKEAGGNDFIGEIK
mgnify:CR=1 FL=1